MPTVEYNTPEGQRRDNSDVATARALLSVRIEEHRMKLEEMHLTDSMHSMKYQREQGARETEISKIAEENERMRLQREENGKIREHEVGTHRQNLEHEKEIKRLQMEDNKNAREHEQKLVALKLELAKKEEEREKLKLQGLRLQYADNRHERIHVEKMTALEVERLNSEEEIRRQRSNERKIVIEETQQQINELNRQCEQLERELRKVEEKDTNDLRNIAVLATGVGTAAGAVSGALGTTAAVGLAAGMAAGAATVLAPVAASVAILSGAGYVYRKATSSSRA